MRRIDPSLIANLTTAEKIRLARLQKCVSQCESDALRMLVPHTGQVPIVLGQSPYNLLIGAPRSGKSVITAGMISSAATGISLMLPDGTPAPPVIKKDPPLLIWVIGKGEDHIGMTIHRLLFKPGAFKIIPDNVTGKWRAYDPTNREDVLRKNDSRPAPPLIPPRFIPGGDPDDPKDWAWDDKAAHVFKIAKLTNGTEFHAFTSTGAVKLGDKPDIIWIDEDITRPKYVPEWISRLEEDYARLFWSVFPWSSNDALHVLSNLSKTQADDVKRGEFPELLPDVAEYTFEGHVNPHIAQKVKDRRLRVWRAFGDDEVEAREGGKLAVASKAMYPQFSPWVHSSPPDEKQQMDRVDELLTETSGVPPHDWTCDLIMDPGHTLPGILFAAVPPPHLGVNCGVIWDEILLPRTTAYEKALAVKSKMGEGRIFDRFIIDFHGSIITYMERGEGATVLRQCNEAFHQAGLKCTRTGSSFMLSSGNKKSAILETRKRLMPDHKTGRPWLRIVARACPNTVLQMASYRKKITPDGIVLEDAAPNQKTCFTDCIAYWCESQPEWNPYKPQVEKIDPVYARFLKEEGESEPENATIWCGPPRPSSNYSLSGV